MRKENFIKLYDLFQEQYLNLDKLINYKELSDLEFDYLYNLGCDIKNTIEFYELDTFQKYDLEFKKEIIEIASVDYLKKYYLCELIKSNKYDISELKLILDIFKKANLGNNIVYIYNVLESEIAIKNKVNFDVCKIMQGVEDFYKLKSISYLAITDGIDNNLLFKYIDLILNAKESFQTEYITLIIMKFKNEGFVFRLIDYFLNFDSFHKVNYAYQLIDFKGSVDFCVFEVLEELNLSQSEDESYKIYEKAKLEMSLENKEVSFVDLYNMNKNVAINKLQDENSSKIKVKVDS